MFIDETGGAQAEAEEPPESVDLEELVAMIQLSTVTVAGPDWVRRVTEDHRRWHAAMLGL